MTTKYKSNTKVQKYKIYKFVFRSHLYFRIFVFISYFVVIFVFILIILKEKASTRVR